MYINIYPRTRYRIRSLDETNVLWISGAEHMLGGFAFHDVHIVNSILGAGMRPLEALSRGGGQQPRVLTHFVESAHENLGCHIRFCARHTAGNTAGRQSCCYVEIGEMSVTYKREYVWTKKKKCTVSQ